MVHRAGSRSIFKRECVEPNWNHAYLILHNVVLTTGYICFSQCLTVIVNYTCLQIIPIFLAKWKHLLGYFLKLVYNKLPYINSTTLSCITTLYNELLYIFFLVGERLHSNLSRVALSVWLFVALVVTQSFTASLTSLLIVQRLNVKQIDIETLIKSGAKVGCDGNSYVVEYLETTLGFNPNNIKRIYSEPNYTQALMSGEIAVAFVEVPYVKVFLAKHCAGFTTSGPTLKVGGRFGFVSASFTIFLWITLLFW